MEHPTISEHIERKHGVCGGKPCIKGTRIRVQDIYVWHELEGKSPEEIVAEFSHLTLADVHAALAYFFDHQEEIKNQLTADEAFVEAMKIQTGPGPLEQKLQQLRANKDGENDSVSS